MNSIPIGLAFSLSLNDNAMSNYSNLNEEQKNNIINYVQNCSTGNEAKEKITIAVDELSKGSTSFLID